MKNSEGKIISINKDLYSVLKGTEVFLCTVRGKLKNIKLTVGDNVLMKKIKLLKVYKIEKIL